MIQVADNFNYRGKKPNFDRDSFDTLQDMKNYSENSLDDGHISYCLVKFMKISDYAYYLEGAYANITNCSL